MIALVALGSLYLLVPSYYYFKLPASVRNEKGALEKVLPRWAPDKKLNLGLDLQGGINLVMEVDLDAALAARANNRAVEMQDYFQGKGLTGVVAKSAGEEVQLTAPAGKFDQMIKLADDYEDMRRVTSSGNSVTFAFRPQTIERLKSGAIEQSITAIRNRVDKFGVAEPSIQRQGSNHVQVQLPGFKDPEQAKEFVGKTAQLEFRIVNDEDQTAAKLTLPPGIHLDWEGTHSGKSPYLESKDQKLLTDFLKDKAPAGYVYMLERVEEPGQPVHYRTYLLADKAALTGEYIIDANVEQGQNVVDNTPHVELEFNQRGAKLFDDLTKKNVKKRMAIVLDGVVNSAPVINEEIPNGRAQITMGGYKAPNEILEEARLLARVLKAGALPAPVTIAEQNSVGASLGPELIHDGAIAVLVGAALIILFMLLYYNLSGLFADIALVMNGLIILAALALFGASLSLPGIAGIVLTLGVAVDANVIINERIREEIRWGKSPRTALQVGYDKAFAAIFDSNLTTVISGVVLYQYGTGPVKGFAVTLVIGVVASMFTAIVGTRWMMDWMVAKRPDRLSV